jgi:phage gpG-like protein
VSLAITTEGFGQVRSLIERLALAPDELAEPVAVGIERQMERRIDVEKRAPSGAQWPGWSASYAASGQGREMLERSGRLLGSVQHVISGGAIEVGSALVYAPVVNRRRPFVGLGSDDLRELDAIIDAALERLARAA